MPQAVVPPSVLICALGDSRTFGAGATIGHDPMTLLAARLHERFPLSQFAVDNQAINGTSLRFWAHDPTLSLALTSFQQSALGILHETRTYVQIMLGVNDASEDQRLSVADYSSCMQALIDKILAARLCGFAGIVLHCSYYGVPRQFSPAIDERSMELVQEYNRALLSLANDTTVFAGDRQAYAFFERRPELLFDALHASNEGNAELASLWARVYESLLPIKVAF